MFLRCLASMGRKQHAESGNEVSRKVPRTDVESSPARPSSNKANKDVFDTSPLVKQIEDVGSSQVADVT